MKTVKPEIHRDEVEKLIKHELKRDVHNLELIEDGQIAQWT